jgi:hypothetical protein
MNGEPGDHPLTDILQRKIDLFSPAASALIREITALGGKMELEKKFDWFCPPELERFEAELKALRDRLREEAEESGWEIDEHLGWTV